MQPTRHEVELGWGRVSFLEWPAAVDGEAEGASAHRPVVVLLHGGGVDSAHLSWGGLAPVLAEGGYRVIAPDHPGFGHSARAPWRATQQRFVAYAGEFIDALELRRPVLGGISLGGGMTLGLALARPARIRAAVLFGSYGLADRMSEGAWGPSMHALTWLMLRTGLLDHLTRSLGRRRDLLASSMRRNTLRNPSALTDGLLDEIVAEANRPGAFDVFAEWQRDELAMLRLRTNYAARLPSLAVPALVVHGERDTGVPVASARRAAAAMPNARLLVAPGAGHWVQRDRPRLVGDAVLGFLDDLPSDGPPRVDQCGED